MFDNEVTLRLRFTLVIACGVGREIGSSCKDSLRFSTGGHGRSGTGSLFRLTGSSIVMGVSVVMVTISSSRDDEQLLNSSLSCELLLLEVLVVGECGLRGEGVGLRLGEDRLGGGGLLGTGLIDLWEGLGDEDWLSSE